MATNQSIANLNYDTANSNLKKDDLLVVSRAGETYKADADGSLFLPETSSTNRGKTLAFSSTGAVIYTGGEAIMNTTITLSSSNVNNTNFNLISGKDFRDYSLFCFVANTNNVYTIPRIVFETATTESSSFRISNGDSSDVKIWRTGNTTFKLNGQTGATLNKIYGI